MDVITGIVIGNRKFMIQNIHLYKSCSHPFCVHNSLPSKTQEEANPEENQNKLCEKGMHMNILMNLSTKSSF